MCISVGSACGHPRVRLSLDQIVQLTPGTLIEAVSAKEFAISASTSKVSIPQTFWLASTNNYHPALFRSTPVFTL